MTASSSRPGMKRQARVALSARAFHTGSGAPAGNGATGLRLAQQRSFWGKLEGRQNGKEAKADMKALGMLLGISMAAWFAPHAGAAGCQFDMQCKGERICENSQCVTPGAGAQDHRNVQQPGSAPTAPKSVPRVGQPAAAPPATRNVPAPAPAPKAAPMTTRLPAPEPAPAEQSGMASPAVANSPAPLTEFRFCCTKVGRFPLDPESSADGPLKPGDACYGITSYGTPLPGTPCN